MGKESEVSMRQSLMDKTNGERERSVHETVTHGQNKWEKGSEVSSWTIPTHGQNEWEKGAKCPHETVTHGQNKMGKESEVSMRLSLMDKTNGKRERSVHETVTHLQNEWEKGAKCP